MKFMLNLALPLGVALASSMAFAQSATSQDQRGTTDEQEGLVAPEPSDQQGQTIERKKTQTEEEIQRQPGAVETQPGEVAPTEPGAVAPYGPSVQPAPEAAPVPEPYAPPAEEGREKAKPGETGAYGPYMTPTAEEETAKKKRIRNLDIVIGGGPFNYSDKAMRDATDLGGFYTARLGIGVDFPIGLEVGYIGSAQGIDTVGINKGADLLSNGFEGELRLTPFKYWVQPYVVGGAGYKHYYIINEDFNTSALNASNNVFELPVGAGVAFKGGNLILDARGEYRFEFSDNILDTRFGPGQDNWAATLRGGIVF